MTLAKAATLDPGPVRRARNEPHAGWLAGLTWKGVALIALMCLLNAARRASDLIVLEPIQIWLPYLSRTFASGLVVAALVTVAVVATYNRAPPRHRLLALGLAIAISTVIGDAILFAIDTGGTFDFKETDGRPVMAILATWPRHALLAALLTTVFVHVRNADGSVAAAQQAEADRANYAQQMDEARLQMLQAQIEPHFLFNTLANVRRLYRNNPTAGETMLDNLMRYFEVALPQMRASGSTLGREAALVDSYLAIQQIRMGPRLRYEVDIPHLLEDAPVPPMMLLTLVENAIKHGLAPLPEGGSIRVSAEARAGRLHLRVADSGAGFGEAASGGGTGLANIRARLRSIFGAAGELALERNEPRGVTAEIILPRSAIEAPVGMP